MKQVFLLFLLFAGLTNAFGQYTVKADVNPSIPINIPESYCRTHNDVNGAGYQAIKAIYNMQSGRVRNGATYERKWIAEKNETSFIQVLNLTYKEAVCTKEYLQKFNSVSNVTIVR